MNDNHNSDHKKRRFSILPSKKWQVPAIISFGSLLGLGFYTLHFSKATSYLSDDPKACINCHVMTPEYMTWAKSSHRRVVSCNDCHVPHNNIFAKYFFKAKDGLYHSYVFTTRTEPQVIRAKEASINVIQQNCIRCHENQVTDAKTASTVQHHVENRTSRTCWECHEQVPHGNVKSLSSVGYLIEPTTDVTNENEQIVPEWLQKNVQEQEKNKSKKQENK
uniref:cytochrome c nitrite reductase small subunit n=1 Tax=Ornithobacterium rhinotracheale TaxID=28251 RepID=UPI0039A6340A